MLKDGTVEANRISLQGDLLKERPEWLSEDTAVPYKARQMAIDDACIAVKTAKKLSKKDKKQRTIKFRSKKKQEDTIYLPKEAIAQGRIYPRLLGDMKFSEQLPEVVAYDCRLKYDHGEFYVTVPFDAPIKVPENQREFAVAVDPGIRTFVTYYSPEEVGKIGEHDFGTIARLCYYMDRLQSKKAKENTTGKRKALFRFRKRIKNLIDEIHWKTARYLTDRYETILIPKMGVAKMAKNLRSKTARSMLTYSHCRFVDRLRLKCEERGSTLIIVNESYTSKTCSCCGTITEIGSKEEWRCASCGCEHDRDINGARGIYLRALRDYSWRDKVSLAIQHISGEAPEILG